MPENSSKSAQTSINERLNFLIKSLNLSARAFSAVLGVPDSNTRNYLSKGTKLNSDYLESIASHFSHVNLSWLISGIGEPFVGEPSLPSRTSSTRIKNNQGQIGQVIGTNHGTATQNSYSVVDCEKERDAYKTERDLARAELAGLRQQLEMAQALIEAHKETISLLRGGYNRPN